MPKEVSARWRVNAFRKAWSAAAAPGCREGRRRLLALLPLWALTIGSGGAALAAEVAREALQAGNDRELAAALARVAGDLVCVLSRQAAMRRKNGEVEVYCPKCSGEKKGPRTAAGSTPTLTVQDVEHLLKLVGNPGAKILVTFQKTLQGDKSGRGHCFC